MANLTELKEKVSLTSGCALCNTFNKFRMVYIIATPPLIYLHIAFSLTELTKIMLNQSSTISKHKHGLDMILHPTLRRYLHSEIL